MKKKIFELLSKLMLFVLAVVCGGAAMAVEVMKPGTDGADPNEGTPLENAREADPVGIEQPAHAATASALEDANLVESKVNNYVTKYHSHLYPMHTDFLREAQQIKVSTPTPTDYEVGEAIIDLATMDESVGNLTESDGTFTPNTGKQGTILLSVHGSDKELFIPTATVLVDNVSGFDENNNEDGSPLVLYVESVDSDGVRVIAVNGYEHQGQMYTPSIPEGSSIHLMATALSESEVEVEPSSMYPEPKQFYLQRKACAMTYTKLFEEIEKQAAWNVQDIKNHVLDKFRRECTYTMLAGAKGKKRKKNSRTGVEYIYFQEGVLRQIRTGYQIDPNAPLTLADLIGITKMVFGEFATTNEMDAYCGSDFIEKLLNIDLGDHREVSMSTTKELEVDVTTFKSTFGTLKFKHEYGLNKIGMRSSCVIFSMKDAKRLYLTKGDTYKIDHSKGEGGEVRDAKSEYYIQNDCLALRGFNSMLVGPDVSIMGFSNIEKTVSKVDTLGASGNANTIYYLPADSGDYTAGLYVWENSEWTPYKGEING